MCLAPSDLLKFKGSKGEEYEVVKNFHFPALLKGVQRLLGPSPLENKGTCNFQAFPKWRPLKLMTIWLIVLFVRISYSSDEPDVEGEALIGFLKVLNDSRGRITDWNDHFTSPCFSWSYITCRNGHVISLDLASYGLSGTLSHSITKLKFLVNLDLQNNDLSGLLPGFLGDMVHLETLNLANNKFSGSIPANWGQLSNLKHLDLSSNNLTGRIPMQLFSVPTFNFTGTHLACGSSLEQPCVSTITFPVSTNRSKIKIVITSSSCVALILLSLGALFVYRFNQVHKLRRDVFVDVAGEDDNKISFSQLRRFSWREIQLATDNFSECNIIGQGGFGKVYKGVLSDNTKVAVKRLADYYSPGGEAAFQREVQLISVAVHKNLLRLIGFCTTSSEKILVYPFMQNLSVAYQLRDFARLEEEEDVLLLDHTGFEHKLHHGALGETIKKLLREDRIDDIVDGNLKIYDPKEVKTIVRVALLCTQSSFEDRPTMAEVVKMLEGVGVAERWAEWEELEQARNQEFMLYSHQFIWAEDSSVDQEAIQLSRAR
ncbi:hypothetical protein SCA6_013694 [Theobroma cacao]